jgi:hypothetical protein
MQSRNQVGVYACDIWRYRSGVTEEQVFWDVTLCGYVSFSRRFGKSYFLQHVENRLPNDVVSQPLRMYFPNNLKVSKISRNL